MIRSTGRPLAFVAGSLLVLLAAFGPAGCLDNPPPAKTSDDVPITAAPPKAAGSLVKEDLVVGKGATAQSGSAVTVDYTGTLVDGTKFDSSKDRSSPFSFIIGGGQVIRGWEQGVVGMKVGGRRKLTIPPQLGYGHEGRPPTIPPDATLIFDIELIHVVE